MRGTEILPSDTPSQYLQKLARITLDEMLQLVGVLDTDGTLLECNRAALEGGGLTREDVIGKPFWETFWWTVSPKTQEDLRDAVRRAAQGELIRYDVDVYARSAGKELMTMDFTLRPVKDPEGRVVFLLPEGRDITEKKKQEKEIAQKNIELMGLLERIRELDEIKSTFFANVSHELRTPLALILGPAQRLIDDDGAMDPSQRKETAQVIARSARMLLKHVNDLLDISKLEAGKLKIELADIDVAAHVRFLASHFEVLAAERGIELTVDAKEPCIAAVDADKLQRILMNLLANAFKFTPAGGRVWCALRASAREISISVDDSGPGVKPELRQAIFERFRQIRDGNDRHIGGTGLGLAIAKELIVLHKGRIDVQSSELGGARFVITLPLHRISLSPSASALTSPEGSVDRNVLGGLLEELRPQEKPPQQYDLLKHLAFNRPRVLVVEDNADMNRFVSQALSKEYDVLVAFNGQEGLDKAIQLRPALVIADIMMPHMSGVEMIAEMRKRPDLDPASILLLSAKADEELMVKLLENGAQDFIVKPFNERDLLVRVKNLILAQQAREDASRALAREREAHKVAESANRAKDEFLAMLGHELRNPLSPILTALQLMKIQGPDKSERARTVIERQVNHLTRLVDDLLDVSRIARGKIELKMEVVEISGVVANAIEMASPLLEQRSHKLTVNVSRRGLRVNGDPTRLSQVVSNLLTNAAKYTPPGGHISVVAEHVGDDVVLRVSDTGIGIAPEVLPHIFDLFVQEHQEIDRSQGGLGLGLTIVRNIIARHGGSVSAQSDGPGHGSELIVRLPCVTRVYNTADLRAAALAAEAAAPPASALRVLIVDDNEDAADMLAAVLTRRGYHTRVANDGPAALQIAEEFVPEVAFLDIGLPVMDGFELAGHLRRLPGLSEVHLIAVTGYGQDSDRLKTSEAGFHHHLVKPIDIASIEKAVSTRASGLAPRL